MAVDSELLHQSLALPLPLDSEQVQLTEKKKEKKKKKKKRTHVLKGEIHRLEKECSGGSQGPRAWLDEPPEDLALTRQPRISKMD